MKIQTNLKAEEFKCRYKDLHIPRAFQDQAFWLKFVIDTATIVDVEVLKYLYIRQNIEEYTMYGELEEKISKKGFNVSTLNYRIEKVLHKRLGFFKIEKDNGNRQIRIYKDKAFIKDVLKAISRWSIIGKGDKLKPGAPQQLIKKYKLQSVVDRFVTRFLLTSTIKELYESNLGEKIDHKTTSKYLDELHKENLILGRTIKKRNAYKRK